MTKLNDQMITEAIETLGAAFPWDSVEMWVERKPEGETSFYRHAQFKRDLRL